MLVPTIWAWRLLRSDDSATYAELDRWTISLNPPGPQSNRVPSPDATLQSVTAIFGKVERWLPVAVLTEGQMHVNGQTISIDRLVWRRGKFQSTPQPAADHLSGATNFAWQARARS